MTLSIKDHLSIDQFLKNIYVFQDLDDFIVTAMRDLPNLIECHTIGYNEVDYAARRMMTVVNSPVVQKHYHDKQLVFESIMRQNPLIDHYSAGADEPKRISDFLSLDEWRATALYQSYYGVIGAEHQIAVALPVEDGSAIAFAFNRSESDFTERHLSILSILQPHLTQAFKNARDYTRLKRSVSHSEQVLERMGAGWMELDGNLTIVDATPLARANLDSFFGNDWDAGGRLPADAEQWILEHIDRARRGNRVAPLVINNQSGRLIVRLLTTDETDECSLLTERFIDTNSPQTLIKLGLTRRQADVLFWICQGKSNAEIAILLKISIRTVTFHVSHILSALNVSNRTEAANLAATHLASRN